jgi:hypothetical protein
MTFATTSEIQSYRCGFRRGRLADPFPTVDADMIPIEAPASQKPGTARSNRP